MAVPASGSLGSVRCEVAIAGFDGLIRAVTGLLPEASVAGLAGEVEYKRETVDPGSEGDDAAWLAETRFQVIPNPQKGDPSPGGPQAVPLVGKGKDQPTALVNAMGQAVTAALEGRLTIDGMAVGAILAIRAHTGPDLARVTVQFVRNVQV